MMLIWRARGRAARALLLAVALLAIGCGDDDTPAGPASAGPVAVFEPASTGSIAWGSIPFPSDVYLGSDGKLTDLPAPSDLPVWGHIIEGLEMRRGFCTTCAAHFPVRGEIDRASLITSDPPSVDDAALLINVDAESAQLGTAVRAAVEWDHELEMVTVRPARGVVLAANTRYAVALTTRVADSAGGALRAADGFTMLRDGVAGDGAAGDAAARFSSFVSPALDELEAAGLARASIASATVFTTDSPVDHIGQLASIVDAYGAPTATVDATWSSTDGSLDALFGIPEAGTPGLDATPMAGSVGTRALAHEHVDLVVSGTISSPRIVEGTGLDVGVLRRDGEGGVATGGDDERVPFLLSIPKTGDRTNMPVAIVHWGVGGQRVNGMVLADTLGQHGIAVMGIDGFQHGERAASAKDAVHELRGDDGELGPDGISENEDLAVTVRLFGIDAENEDDAMSPRFPLANLSQTTVDSMAVLQWLHDGDVSALQAADPALAGLSFDSEHVFFVGESLGTVAGSALLTQDRRVAAAALAVAPGSLVDLFCEAPVYRSLAGLFMKGSFGVDGAQYDEVDRHLCAHPALQMYRWALEPIEPIALAPHIFRAPVASNRPDLLLIYGELDESVGTAPPDGFVSAIGLPASGTFEFAPVTSATLPLADNHTSGSQTVTAGAVRLLQAGHGLLGQRAQSSAYMAPIVPPFEGRRPTLDFDNPTDQSHGLVGSLFSTRLTQAHGTIATP